ncbi:MAG TPA: efflux RND transporter periplasmic adaptor subunit [Vicinamibacterales bacterium]|nr:efflux RND transporter periplasmic adaptor subunit [Vicinamibacterales bacterium]
MNTTLDPPQQVVAREPGSPAAVPPPPRWRMRAVLAGVVLAAAALVIVVSWPALFPAPSPQVLRASGRIEGREVTLAAKTIQGRVKRLLADEGQTVKAGQLLAELDAAQVEAQVNAAAAGVATLEAQVRQAALDVAYTAKNSEASIAAARATLSSAQAHVVRANAVMVNAAAAHERADALFRGGAISKHELDAAEMALRTSRADVAAAEKDVTRAEANLALAQASSDTIELKRQQLAALQQSRRSAAARLDEAQANLAERLIVAPEAGTIISRPAEVGDVVNPGSPIFQVVDMGRLYVKVYIPEPDIAKLRLGDPAEVFVDAFPGRSFAARISKIHDQAEFTPKNVETAEERLKLVFGVELALVNPEGLLKPGMPADTVIHFDAPREDDRAGVDGVKAAGARPRHGS